MSEKKLIRIDASLLKQSACFRKFYNIGVEGFRSQYDDCDMIFGSAGHVFLENFLKTKDRDLAISKAISYFVEKSGSPFFRIKNKGKKRGDKSWLDIGYLQFCCEHLATFFSKEDCSWDNITPVTWQDEILVEKTFELIDPPYIETENAIYTLCGTIDLIGLINDGPLIIVDWKFTESWGEEHFLDKFAYDVQLAFYKLCLLLACKRHPGAFADFILNRKILASVGGIFIKQGEPPRLSRSLAFDFTEARLKDLEIYVKTLIASLELYLGEGAFIPATEMLNFGMFNGLCQGMFGHPCEFVGACQLENIEQRQRMLETAFKKEPYNPLLFRK